MHRLVAVLVLCGAATSGADAAPHRPRVAKHAAAKHASPKSAKTKSEPKPEPKPEPAKPAIQEGAASQATDSEEPPARQRAK